MPACPDAGPSKLQPSDRHSDTGCVYPRLETFSPRK